MFTNTLNGRFVDKFPGEALKPEDPELPELDAVSFLEVSKKRSCWDCGY